MYRKTSSLPLTQFENYSFVAFFDKISSNKKKIYLLKFLDYLGLSRHPPKKLDLVFKKYDMLLNTGLIRKLRKLTFQQHIALNSLG